MSQRAGRILAALLSGDGGAPPRVGFEPLRALGVKATKRALRALAGEP